MEEDELVTNLRAIIISSKGGLPLNHVKGDYRETFGTEIPLRKLGYSSLEEFFKRKSEEFKLYSNRVEAVAKSTSIHIASLVNEQNDAKRKVRPKAGSKRRRRPAFSGTYSIYKPVIGHHSISKRPSYDVPPRFHRQISEKQVLSIGKVKDRTDRVSTNGSIKSDKEEYVSKSSKGGETENRRRRSSEKDEKDKSRSEKNHFLSKTLERHGIITKTITNDVNLSRRKNEAQDVFETSASEDLIPFDSFEETEAVSGVQSRFLKQRSKNSIVLNSFEEDSKLSSSEDFETTPKQSSPPSVNPFLSPTAPFTDFEESPPRLFKRSAQSRIEALKSAAGSDSSSNEEPFPNLKHTVNSADEWTTKLMRLCSLNGYPEPTYEDTRSEPDRYFSKVVIGDKFKLSSYPVEQPDEKGARESAAKKAYHHITSELNFVQQERPRVEAAVISKILDLVSESYGIWSDKLTALYLEKYSEALDENWFSIIQKSPEFEINPVDDKRFIVSKKSESPSVATEEEILKNVIRTSLTLPGSVHWEIYVVNVKNSSQVWCRLIGDEYSDVYDAIMTQLELDPPERKVKVPVPEQIYAVNVEDTWNRVKFIGTKGNNIGTVFFIDSGEEEEVELSELYFLEPSYLDLPPQALSLSLHELDCFAEDRSVNDLLLSKLLGHIYIAEIVSLLDVGKSVASVVFWDTSTEEDINVNKILLDAVVAEILPPRLEKNNQIKEVFVSEITDEGDIYVVTSMEAVERINCMILKQTATGCDKNAFCTPETVSSNELYLTRCEKTGKYGRAKVTEKTDTDHVVVLFVDDGITQKTNVGDMYHISKLSISLASIPPQALKVRLENSKVWDSKMAWKLREIIPRDEVVLVKRIEAKGDVPFVDIFRRSTEDNSLCSIGNELSKISTLQPNEDRSRKKSEAIGLENVLYNNLRPPPVSDVGKYYDVYVTLAASPDLFMVQPLRTINELSDMMDKLQGVCGKSAAPSLHETDCIVGNLYAVKHHDGSWYRGVLHAVLGSSMFSVYLCDFGDFVIAPLERLTSLPDKPCDIKSLPYQAIRAKLYGVAPVNKDWSPIDCVYFQELVVDKEFVSTVKEIDRDPKNPNNITLELTLTDTSGEDDVYIHKLLIERKSAVDISRIS